MSSSEAMLRRAVLADLGAITEIYNHAVRHGVASFDHHPRAIRDQYQWFNNRGARYPIFVAEQEGRVVGWGALLPYSSRQGYYLTAEASCYIDPSYQGRQLGTQITERLIETAESIGFHVLIALIEESNHASIHIAEKLGFCRAGCLPEVGRKFDRWLNVVIMHRKLGSHRESV